MQMTDFGSAADLYPPAAANNWYSSQFSSIGNSFSGLNSNLTGSPGGHHQLNTLNQLHHSAASLDSATNAVLHNSPPNSTSPQHTTGAHPQAVAGSQLTNLSNLSTNNGLPSLTATQTTQSNHSTQQLLSPTQTQQSRSNALSLNLSTSSNSTSTNGSNNALPAYSAQVAAVNGSSSSSANSVAAHLHHQAHQFNIPSHLSAVHSAAAQHSTHSQFSPHSLAGHHSHQHPLNHLTAHHFLNVANVPNNFFPVHHANHAASSLTGGPSAFTAPPSPSSPNNTSINSTTTAFNSLTFHRPDSASNTPGSAMNAVAAITAMSRVSGLSPTENAGHHHQLNGGGSGYERMHTGYSGYPSLIDHHHHSSRAAGLEHSFVNLRHMPTLTNLTSNCNTGNGLNNLDDSNVNSMFIAHHHNQSLNPASLMACHNQNHAGTPGLQLVPLHASTHNSSVNSSSDSREDDMGLNCLGIKQEEEDDKLTAQFTTGAPLDVHHHPLSYNWVKKTSHSSQAQAGNKR